MPPLSPPFPPCVRALIHRHQNGVLEGAIAVIQQLREENARLRQGLAGPCGAGEQHQPSETTDCDAERNHTGLPRQGAAPTTTTAAAAAAATAAAAAGVKTEPAALLGHTVAECASVEKGAAMLQAREGKLPSALL